MNTCLGTYDVIPAIAQSYSYKYISPSEYMEAMKNTFNLFCKYCEQQMEEFFKLNDNETGDLRDLVMESCDQP